MLNCLCRGMRTQRGTRRQFLKRLNGYSERRKESLHAPSSHWSFLFLLCCRIRVVKAGLLSKIKIRQRQQGKIGEKNPKFLVQNFAYIFSCEICRHLAARVQIARRDIQQLAFFSWFPKVSIDDSFFPLKLVTVMWIWSGKTLTPDASSVRARVCVVCWWESCIVRTACLCLW